MNDPSQISTVIFDCGGVIFLHDDLLEIAKFLAKKYSVDFALLYGIIVKNWLAARTNARYDGRFWREIAELLQITPKQAAQEFIRFPTFNAEVIAIARTLKKQYRVALLSNHVLSLLEPSLRRRRINTLFSPIVTSYSTHIAKPDPGIYKKMLELLKTPAKQCVFIDDREANLITARKFGMQTILFKNAKQLETSLQRLHLLS